MTTTINWDKIKNFVPSEFPDDPDKNAQPELIQALDKFRSYRGKRIFPSPVKGALARFGGSKFSQHYAIGRKSTAVDFFCEGVAIEVFMALIATNIFSGIGVYLDTTGPDGHPWILFHADLRKKSGVPTIWIVEKVKGADKYRYPQRQPEYWRLFQDSRLYSQRKFIR